MKGLVWIGFSLSKPERAGPRKSHLNRAHFFISAYVIEYVTDIYYILYSI